MRVIRVIILDIILPLLSLSYICVVPLYMYIKLNFNLVEPNILWIFIPAMMAYCILIMILTHALYDVFYFSTCGRVEAFIRFITTVNILLAIAWTVIYLMFWESGYLQLGGKLI